MENIELPELAEEVVDRVALTTGKHRIRIMRAEPVVMLRDRRHLEQVLVNLFDNAIKYSPDGGTSTYWWALAITRPLCQ